MQLFSRNIRRTLMTMLGLSLGFVGGVTGLYAQSAATHASYVVNMGGINAAYINIRFDTDGRDYQLDLTADVAGLAQIIASGSGVVNSTGKISSSGLASERFFLETRAEGERFSLESQYSNGTANRYVVNPPLTENADRVAVSSAHRNGVNDPLAAFIVRGAALNGDLCRREMKIFTGIERFDMKLGFSEMQEATSGRTGYQGPVVLCAMRYVPISGHFRSSEITNYLKDNQRMLIWYMPLKDSGYYIPYRVLIGTNFGDLSMVLTKLN